MYLLIPRGVMMFVMSKVTNQKPCNIYPNFLSNENKMLADDAKNTYL